MSELLVLRRPRPPAVVPPLLSFTAGFIDSFTVLALFGLFVAQVTGSFVLAAAAMVTNEQGALTKLLAIPVFLLAAVATTILAVLLERRGRAALAWVLGLECAVLTGFLLTALIGRPLTNPNARTSVPADDFTAEAAAWTLTAHEARPGHELQFAAMVERGVSIARAAFAFNNTNAEGWALYAEAVMLPYFPAEGQLFSLQLRLQRAARAFLDPMINLGRADVKVLDDGWTAVTRDRSLSAQFEHSIGITDTGCEIFTKSPAGFDRPPY